MCTPTTSSGQANLSLTVASSMVTSGAAMSADITWATVMAFMLAICFVPIGLCVLCLPNVWGLVIALESALAIGLLGVFNALLILSLNNLDLAWRKLVVLIVGALALAYTAMKNETIAVLTQDAVLGYLLAHPLIALLRDLLFRQSAGCDGYGAREERFPDGIPLECDITSSAFRGALYVCFALWWVICLVFVLLALCCVRCRPRLNDAARAVAGATVLVYTAIELAFEMVRLGGSQDMSAVRRALMVLRLILVYVLAALGMFMASTSVGKRMACIPGMSCLVGVSVSIEARFAGQRAHSTATSRTVKTSQAYDTVVLPKHRAAPPLRRKVEPSPDEGTDFLQIGDVHSLHRLRWMCLQRSIEFSITDGVEVLQKKLGLPRAEIMGEMGLDVGPTVPTSKEVAPC